MGQYSEPGREEQEVSLGSVQLPVTVHNADT